MPIRQRTTAAQLLLEGRFGVCALPVLDPADGHFEEEEVVVRAAGGDNGRGGCGCGGGGGGGRGGGC